MDKLLRPAVLTEDPGSSTALKTWRHWKRTLDFFLASLPTADGDGQNKLGILIHFLGPNVYELIADSDSYDSAIRTLECAFDKPKNEVFASRAGKNRDPANVVRGK